MYVTHCERVQMIEHIHYKIVEQTLSVETLRQVKTRHDFPHISLQSKDCDTF